MFFHNFKYSLKILFRNKMLIFWTFAFPILLGTFFFMAFSDIEKEEKLEVMDIAIVDNDEFEQNMIFKETFKVLGEEGSKEQLYHISYTTLEEAKELLEDKKVVGYLFIDKQNAKIFVRESGINETILRVTVDEIESTIGVIDNILKIKAQEYRENDISVDYKKIYTNIISSMEKSGITLNNIANKNLSYTMIEFYTLIAMTCLYGGILSMYITNYKLGNMNGVGKRTSISSVHKGKLLLSSLLASYVTQLIGLFLLFIYTIFILKVDYGSHLSLVILITCIGALAGLSLGVLVSTLVKSDENTKTGILIAITMLWSFLSGMMGITMKYIIDKNIPLLNSINPVNMITDGFYTLYYYNTLNRYFKDVIGLLLFSLIMILVSYRGLRRQKYDSI